MDEKTHGTLDEVERLQYNPQDLTDCDMKKPLPVRNARSFHLKLKLDLIKSRKIGVSVLNDAESDEETRIYVDLDTQKLVVNTEKSGTEGSKIKEEAPFALKDGETLDLDIFVDCSIVEVYANERQAVCRKALPTNPEVAIAVSPIGLDGAKVISATAFEIAPTNLY